MEPSNAALGMWMIRLQLFQPNAPEVVPAWLINSRVARIAGGWGECGFYRGGEGLRGDERCVCMSGGGRVGESAEGREGRAAMGAFGPSAVRLPMRSGVCVPPWVVRGSVRRFGPVVSSTR